MIARATLTISLILPLLATATTAADHPPRRSLGYGGSTPVGLDGYGAAATFDCAAINADRRRGRLRTPLGNDCRLSIPSPDNRLVVRSMPAPDGSSVLRVTGGLRIAGLDQPTILLWKPDSSGFLLNGGEGSGQISHLRYFHRTRAGWRESGRLDATAAKLYRRRFDCRNGAGSYTNTSGWDWLPTGLLRVIVQEGVHSEGCLQPHEDRDVLLEVIGDPVTGRIASARAIATLR